MMNGSAAATIIPVASESTEDAEKRPPTRDEKAYGQLLADYLGPVSFVLILLVCLLVYRFPQPVSEQLADDLTMNQAEQEMIIPAVAGILDKQKFAPELKKRILQSGDLVGLTLGLTSYGLRVAGTLQAVRREWIYAQSGGAPAGQTPASQNGHAAGGDNAGSPFLFNQFVPDR